jgi:predicted MFS family arabinose efflux permease
MAAGGVGILVATVPAEMAIQAVGWRGMFFGLVAMSLAVAAIIFFVVPERAERPKAQPLGQQIRAVGTIYSSPVFWRLAPLVALTAGVQIGVQTLWAGPWLRDVAGLDRAGVASYLAMMAVGFLVGTLTIGGIADWLGRKGVGLLTVMLGFIFVFMACEVAIIAEWTALTAPLWFVFGMIGQSAILAYPWLASYFGVALAGRANTAMNFITFSTAFLTQYVIGAIIDLWPKTEAGGYAKEAYQAAFGLFLALQCLALLWFFLKRPDERARAQLLDPQSNEA